MGRPQYDRPEYIANNLEHNRVLRWLLLTHWDRGCAWCGEPLYFKDSEIDHIMPKSPREGHQRILGVHNAANLAPLCGRCNKGKSNFIYTGRYQEDVAKKAEKLAPSVARSLKKLEQEGNVSDALVSILTMDTEDEAQVGSLRENAPSIIQIMDDLGIDPSEVRIFRGQNPELAETCGGGEYVRITRYFDLTIREVNLLEVYCSVVDTDVESFLNEISESVIDYTREEIDLSADYWETLTDLENLQPHNDPLIEIKKVEHKYGELRVAGTCNLQYSSEARQLDQTSAGVNDGDVEAKWNAITIEVDATILVSIDSGSHVEVAMKKLDVYEGI